jgi:hypothetical protein
LVFRNAAAKGFSFDMLVEPAKTPLVIVENTLGTTMDAMPLVGIDGEHGLHSQLL